MNELKHLIVATTIKDHAIYSDQWERMTADKRIDVLRRAFPSVQVRPVCFVPAAVERLRLATVELLEDRTESTVYRIRQTGQVYVLTDEDNDGGAIPMYPNYEHYQRYGRGCGELIATYSHKELVHVYTEDAPEPGTIHVHRLQYPRFRAVYDPATGELNIMESIDPVEPDRIDGYIHKAKAFLTHYWRGNLANSD